MGEWGEKEEKNMGGGGEGKIEKNLILICRLFLIRGFNLQNRSRGEGVVCLLNKLWKGKKLCQVEIDIQSFILLFLIVLNFIITLYCCFIEEYINLKNIYK